ncbi:O-methyltransferase-domain-containing protein [Aspergillus alliaceus]|uniref:O-methyltransferase-domain-containing protein n=1 Tax=Petromyces alliaceus TaxID=209559 RepID=UPI0012A5EA14|nr:O-methyltransferase-domain-containing protein [Aspergillus alliaceus]KAB8230798.1 O-methyltransferase-domain-containing protein [Aspergillus alliaceus]
MSTIQSLSTLLSQKAGILARELRKFNLDNYVFEDEHAPIELPLLSAEGSSAKADVIAAAEQIVRLARGPLGYLQTYASTGVEIGTIRALVKLGIPSMIPLGESKSYHELASMSDVSVDVLKRLIGLARVCGFLAVDDQGNVKHNAMSSIFVKNQQASGGAAWTMEVYSKSSPEIYESLRLSPKGDDPRACAVSLAYQKGDVRPTLWEINARSPTLDRQFHELMASSCSSSVESVEHIVNGFDWESISSLVDVGGSIGHTSLAISSRYTHLRCIVQDTEKAISQASATNKVFFMEHDFFQPQKVVADAYLYRFILHDWSDEDAKRILAAAVAGLRKGAWLIIMDMVAPDQGTVPLYMEKYIRTLDIAMYALLAGKERSLHQFQSLVAAVEPQLRFEGCSCPPGSALSIMTWRYEGCQKIDNGNGTRMN